MKQSKLLDHLTAQQEFYKKVFSLVHKIVKKKVYKLSISVVRKVLRDGVCIYESVPTTLIVTPMAYNTQSIRFLVLAGDVGVHSWGGTFTLSTEKSPNGDRFDTITLNFNTLIDDTTTIEEISQGEMPMYIGCEFVHPKFRKYLEAA